MNIESITKAVPKLINPIAMPDLTDPLKASAVLIILHKIEQKWHILLTKRAEHLSSHAGQISFPGGRYETHDEHLLDTALRETEEEIGLDRNHLQVFGQLEEHPTMTGYRIFPYIAYTIDLPELTIDKEEVDEILNVPLSFLMESRNQQLETALYQKKKYDYYKIIWNNKNIWGATARMIVELTNHIR
ncbi:MAG: CoA pyrophosphatase [Gammaproteobacteria bacterium]|nr:CoA pyrophosphatase [Gammaproteobacteria bacterium]